jgi:hypothetical protein
MTQRIKRVVALALALTFGVSSASFAAVTNTSTRPGGAVYSNKCEYMFAYSFSNGYVATCYSTVSSSKTTHLIDSTARVYSGGGTCLIGYGATTIDGTSKSMQASVYNCSTNSLDYYCESRAEFQDSTYGNWINTVQDKDGGY